MKQRSKAMLRNLCAAATCFSMACAFSSPPSESLSQGRPVLDSYKWERNPPGAEIAAKREVKSFNFAVLGDLSYYSFHLVTNIMQLLSSASGLTLDRNAKYSAVILHDRNVFTRAKTDKKAFDEVGIGEKFLGCHVKSSR